MNRKQNPQSAAQASKGDGAEAVDICTAWLPLATRAPSEKNENTEPPRAQNPRHTVLGLALLGMRSSYAEATPGRLTVTCRSGSHTVHRNCARCALGAWACCSGTVSPIPTEEPPGFVLVLRLGQVAGGQSSGHPAPALALVLLLLHIWA